MNHCGKNCGLLNDMLKFRSLLCIFIHFLLVQNIPRILDCGNYKWAVLVCRYLWKGPMKLKVWSIVLGFQVTLAHWTREKQLAKLLLEFDKDMLKWVCLVIYFLWEIYYGKMITSKHFIFGFFFSVSKMISLFSDFYLEKFLSDLENCLTQGWTLAKSCLVKLIRILNFIFKKVFFISWFYYFFCMKNANFLTA